MDGGDGDRGTLSKCHINKECGRSFRGESTGGMNRSLKSRCLLPHSTLNQCLFASRSVEEDAIATWIPREMWSAWQRQQRPLPGP